VSRREVDQTRLDGTFVAERTMSASGSVQVRSMEQLDFNFAFSSTVETSAEKSRCIDRLRDCSLSASGDYGIVKCFSPSQSWSHVPATEERSASAPIYFFVQYRDARQRAARLSLFERVLEHAKSLPW